VRAFTWLATARKRSRSSAQRSRQFSASGSRDGPRAVAAHFRPHLRVSERPRRVVLEQERQSRRDLRGDQPMP
jgi:hypothetical protein